MVYQSALREHVRQLNEHAAKLQRQQVVDENGAFDEEKHSKIVARMGVLLQRMSGELTQECQRIGAWGVLGEGTGAMLIDPQSGQPMTKDQIFGRFHNL